MVAALFVETDGCYFGLPDVDPWDAKRDARTYPGPWSVVAHPPCSRWCRLAGLVEARWGHKRGDDDGCFASALESVRKFGGVLEHPAYSDAWSAFCLPTPVRHGGWQRGLCGGWSCHIEQGRYGHPAKKATWLYAYGINPGSMKWGSVPSGTLAYWVSWCGNHVRKAGKRPRLSQKRAAATTVEFRDALLAIARSVTT